MVISTIEKKSIKEILVFSWNSFDSTNSMEYLIFPIKKMFFVIILPLDIIVKYIFQLLNGTKVINNTT